MLCLLHHYSCHCLHSNGLSSSFCSDRQATVSGESWPAQRLTGSLSYNGKRRKEAGNTHSTPCMQVSSHQVNNICNCHGCWRTIYFLLKSSQSVMKLSCPKYDLSHTCLREGHAEDIDMTSCLLKNHKTLNQKSFNCREFRPQQFRVTLIAKVLWMFSSQFIAREKARA